MSERKCALLNNKVTASNETSDLRSESKALDSTRGMLDAVQNLKRTLTTSTSIAIRKSKFLLEPPIAKLNKNPFRCCRPISRTRRQRQSHQHFRIRFIEGVSGYNLLDFTQHVTDRLLAGLSGRTPIGPLSRYGVEHGCKVEVSPESWERLIYVLKRETEVA
ncbi:hypothetical protein [Caballeronia sp. S22]|uniref:hypothetical protein n=1 Tax=Caballeronia sp. S22 TaxID=3137182 RepID=UPI003530CB82